MYNIAVGLAVVLTCMIVAGFDYKKEQLKYNCELIETQIEGKGYE